MDSMSGAPTDAELEHSVLEIPRAASLDSMMKREIRQQLEERFGNRDGPDCTEGHDQC